MRYLELVLLSDIIFNLNGLQRYTKYAVELVSKYSGTNPDNTVNKEEAYLKKDGCLVIQVLSTSGKVMGEFTFSQEEFKIITIH